MDCRTAKDIKKKALANLDLDLMDAEDCWDSLIKEVCDQCEKKTHCPKPESKPPPGYAGN